MVYQWLPYNISGTMLQALGTLGSALNCQSSIILPVPGLLIAEQAQEAYRHIRAHRNKRAVQTMKALVIKGKSHGISREIQRSVSCRPLLMKLPIDDIVTVGSDDAAQATSHCNGIKFNSSTN